jgi:GNAT superfamily N-acetyltransferase
MKYTIKALSPALAITFTEYFEGLDFGHAAHWATCFCRFYHTSCSYELWQKRTGEENRAEAIEQIKAGNMKGYLAFDEDKCIGWCNANNVSQYIRFEKDIKHITKDQKVGCVICFVIHQEYRKQGVARLLLKQAVDDFRSQGFDGVLAIPVDIKDEPEKLYRGTLNMYQELGFEEIEKKDNVSVMWLKLK